MSLYSHALKLYSTFRVETSSSRSSRQIGKYEPNEVDKAAAVLAEKHSEEVLRTSAVMAGLLATKPKEAVVNPSKGPSKGSSLYGREPFDPNNDGPRYA